MTLEEMRTALRPLLGDRRYNHSLAVERDAVELARLYHEDVHKAAVAGLLHDCRKEMPLDEALKIIARSDIITDIIFEDQPGLIHGFAASVTLGDFGVDDPDIKNAVRYHTVARARMSKLEMIVFLADLTAEGRDYPDVDEMRRVTRISLEDGMRYALRYTMGKLVSKERPICRDTWEAYNYYYFGY